MPADRQVDVSSIGGYFVKAGVAAHKTPFGDPALEDAMAERDEEIRKSVKKGKAYFEVSQADFAADSKAWFAKAKMKPVRVFAPNGNFMSIYRPQKPF